MACDLNLLSMRLVNLFSNPHTWQAVILLYGFIVTQMMETRAAHMTHLKFLV